MESEAGTSRSIATRIGRPSPTRRRAARPPGHADHAAETGRVGAVLAQQGASGNRAVAALLTRPAEPLEQRIPAEAKLDPDPAGTSHRKEDELETADVTFKEKLPVLTHGRNEEYVHHPAAGNRATAGFVARRARAAGTRREGSNRERTAYLAPRKYRDAASTVQSIRTSLPFSQARHGQDGAAQRYHDIATRKAELFENYGDDEYSVYKNEFLDDFAAVQRFLSDITQTKPLLDALNAELLRSPRHTLSEILQAKDSSAELIKLVAGVSTEDFSQVVAQGIRFEDWVGASHGIQSHRIQWFMIGQHFNNSDDLYRESVDPYWTVNGAFGARIWDLVVDSTHANNETDFTKPETLQNYLRQTYWPGRWFNIFKRLGSLVGPGLRRTAQEETANFDSDKQGFMQGRPEIRQVEKPDARDTAEGTWTGWKPAMQDGVRVWTPTILIPRVLWDL